MFAPRNCQSDTNVELGASFPLFGCSNWKYNYSYSICGFFDMGIAVLHHCHHNHSSAGLPRSGYHHYPPWIGAVVSHFHWIESHGYWRPSYDDHCGCYCSGTWRWDFDKCGYSCLRIVQNGCRCCCLIRFCLPFCALYVAVQVCVECISCACTQISRLITVYHIVHIYLPSPDNNFARIVNRRNNIGLCVRVMVHEKVEVMLYTCQNQVHSQG